MWRRRRAKEVERWKEKKSTSLSSPEQREAAVLSVLPSSCRDLSEKHTHTHTHTHTCTHKQTSTLLEENCIRLLTSAHTHHICHKAAWRSNISKSLPIVFIFTGLCTVMVYYKMTYLAVWWPGAEVGDDGLRITSFLRTSRSWAVTHTSHLERMQKIKPDKKHYDGQRF